MIKALRLTRGSFGDEEILSRYLKMVDDFIDEAFELKTETVSEEVIEEHDEPKLLRQVDVRRN